MMNANDVLIDLLEDNRRRLHRGLSNVSDDCVIWKPEAEAMSLLRDELKGIPMDAKALLE